MGIVDCRFHSSTSPRFDTRAVASTVRRRRRRPRPSRGRRQASLVPYRNDSGLWSTSKLCASPPPASMTLTLRRAEWPLMLARCSASAGRGSHGPRLRLEVIPNRRPLAGQPLGLCSWLLAPLEWVPGRLSKLLTGAPFPIVAGSDRRRADRDPSRPAPVKIPAAPGVFVGSRHTGRGPGRRANLRCIHVSRRSGPTRPDLYLVSVLRPALCAGAPEAPAAVQQVWRQQPRR